MNTRIFAHLPRPGGVHRLAQYNSQAHPLTTLPKGCATGARFPGYPSKHMSHRRTTTTSAEGQTVRRSTRQTGSSRKIAVVFSRDFESPSSPTTPLFVSLKNGDGDRLTCCHRSVKALVCSERTRSQEIGGRILFGRCEKMGLG